MKKIKKVKKKNEQSKGKLDTKFKEPDKSLFHQEDEQSEEEDKQSVAKSFSRTQENKINNIKNLYTQKIS